MRAHLDLRAVLELDLLVRVEVRGEALLHKARSHIVASNGDEPVLFGVPDEEWLQLGGHRCGSELACAGFRGIFAPAWRTVVLTSPRLM